MFLYSTVSTLNPEQDTQKPCQFPSAGRPSDNEQAHTRTDNPELNFPHAMHKSLINCTRNRVLAHQTAQPHRPTPSQPDYVRFWATTSLRDSELRSPTHRSHPHMLLHLPIVGMVVTTSPSFSLYRIVVFPAASSPTMRMRISFFPNIRSQMREKVSPMVPLFLPVTEVGTPHVHGQAKAEDALLHAQHATDLASAIHSPSNGAERADDDSDTMLMRPGPTAGGQSRPGALPGG